MAQIKLFCPKTYPDSVIRAREKLHLLPNSVKDELMTTEFLCDYINSAIWNAESPIGKLHKELIKILEPHEIVAYHNTRLPDSKSVTSCGLIFSDDRYIDMLKTALNDAKIESVLIAEVIDAVVHERNRWESSSQNRRKNEICFIYDMDYYRAYDKFLAIYGGEFMEFGLQAHTQNGSFLKYRDVIKIGYPYVIEFAIPFSWFHKFVKQDVARYMMEEWIHLDIRKDETKHKYDGRIEREIPANKILEVHEVEDNFPEIDKWLFREEYIK